MRSVNKVKAELSISSLRMRLSIELFNKLFFMHLFYEFAELNKSC